jgi:hypothetical protein
MGSSSRRRFVRTSEEGDGGGLCRLGAPGEGGHRQREELGEGGWPSPVAGARDAWAAEGAREGAGVPWCRGERGMRVGRLVGGVGGDKGEKIKKTDMWVLLLVVGIE